MHVCMCVCMHAFMCTNICTDRLCSHDVQTNTCSWPAAEGAQRLGRTVATLIMWNIQNCHVRTNACMIGAPVERAFRSLSVSVKEWENGKGTNRKQMIARVITDICLFLYCDFRWKRPRSVIVCCCDLVLVCALLIYHRIIVYTPPLGCCSGFRHRSNDDTLTNW